MLNLVNWINSNLDYMINSLVGIARSRKQIVWHRRYVCEMTGLPTSCTCNCQVNSNYLQTLKSNQGLKIEFFFKAMITILEK